MEKTTRRGFFGLFGKGAAGAAAMAAGMTIGVDKAHAETEERRCVDCKQPLTGQALDEGYYRCDDCFWLAVRGIKS